MFPAVLNSDAARTSVPFNLEELLVGHEASALFDLPCTKKIVTVEDLIERGAAIFEPIPAIGKPDDMGNLHPLDTVPGQMMRQRCGVNTPNKNLLAAYLKEHPEFIKNEQPGNKAVFEMGEVMIGDANGWTDEPMRAKRALDRADDEILDRSQTASAAKSAPGDRPTVPYDIEALLVGRESTACVPGISGPKVIRTPRDLMITSLRTPIPAVGRPYFKGNLHPLDTVPGQNLRARCGLNSQNKSVLVSFLEEYPEFIKNDGRGGKVVFEGSNVMIVDTNESSNAGPSEAMA